jgi:hypothetical protein
MRCVYILFIIILYIAACVRRALLAKRVDTTVQFRRRVRRQSEYYYYYYYRFSLRTAMFQYHTLSLYVYAYTIIVPKTYLFVNANRLDVYIYYIDIRYHTIYPVTGWVASTVRRPRVCGWISIQ